MNRKITFLALFATVIFLMLTVVLGFVIHYVGDPSKPVFWLLCTLFIGMFLSLLTCITNLSVSIKISNKIIDAEEGDVSLTTCPDYWTKQIVKDNITNKSHVMCYNHFKDDIFINGQLSQTPPYTFDDNSIFNGSNISNMRELAKYPSNVETFIQYITDPGDPDYEKHKHYHTRIDRIVHSNIVNANGHENVQPHSHTYVNVESGHHSHIGYSQGNEDNNMFRAREYVVTDSNFSHWINPYQVPNTDKMAIELNLDNLNSTTNICELATKFAWSEAYAKCKK